MILQIRALGVATVAALAIYGALASGLVSAGSASAEELRLAHFMSPRHVMDRVMMRPWSKQIAEISGNALTVRIYPAGELGKGPKDQYKRAVSGVADIAFGLQGYISAQFPATTLIELPGLAEDAPAATDMLWRVWESYLYREYKDTKVLALWTNEVAIIMTRDKPVRSLEDLKGMKVRSPSRLSAAMVEALGATPVSMPVTKMYNALKTGVVDALMVPPCVIIPFKIGEVAKYYTINAPLGRSPFFLVMNRKKWNSLSAYNRALIERTTGRDWSLRAAAAYETCGEKGLAKVRKEGSGEIIELSEAEQERWREVLKPLEARRTAELEKQGIPAGKILAQMRSGS